MKTEDKQSRQKQVLVVIFLILGLFIAFDDLTSFGQGFGAGLHEGINAEQVD